MTPSAIDAGMLQRRNRYHIDTEISIWNCHFFSPTQQYRPIETLEGFVASRPETRHLYPGVRRVYREGAGSVGSRFERFLRLGAAIGVIVLIPARAACKKEEKAADPDIRPVRTVTVALSEAGETVSLTGES